MQTDRIYCGDALTVLKTLPDNSVNCCVTSPPYYALRDYGVTDGSKREGVIKKSRKVNTEERDLVGRTAAHGAHQQTIR